LVVLEGKVEVRNDVSSVARLRVVYPVCPGDALTGATLPFISSGSSHDGMGLSVASRFIEMHGGLLRIKTREDEGTEVEISLPVDTTKELSCA
jgi:nitrogen-specific signal transduction histidine kinase